MKDWMWFLIGIVLGHILTLASLIIFNKLFKEDRGEE